MCSTKRLDLARDRTIQAITSVLQNQTDVLARGLIHKPKVCADSAICLGPTELSNITSAP